MYHLGSQIFSSELFLHTSDFSTHIVDISLDCLPAPLLKILRKPDTFRRFNESVRQCMVSRKTGMGLPSGMRG
jgi:hypothetical protein